MGASHSHPDDFSASDTTDSSDSSVCKHSVTDSLDLVLYRESYLKVCQTSQCHRIQEIQKSSSPKIPFQIDSLWECHHLRIKHIEKVYSSTYLPTKSDMEYLNHLFRLDQRLMKELKELLAQGNEVFNLNIQEVLNVAQLECSGCGSSQESELKSWEEGDYIVIKTPETRRRHTCKQLRQQQRCAPLQETLCTSFSQCSRRREMDRRCEADIELNLSEVEKELESIMTRRLEELTASQTEDCPTKKDVTAHPGALRISRKRAAQEAYRRINRKFRCVLI